MIEARLKEGAWCGFFIIFYVKSNLTLKGWLVAGGYRNKSVPAHTTFSTVLSRDSLRICLMLVAFNDLDVHIADIGNTYFSAPCKKRVHVVCGPELFGPDHEGKVALIVRVLHGFKSARNVWRYHFAAAIRDDLEYKSTKANPDVYRKVQHKADKTPYCSYLVVHVDNVLCIHHNP